MAIWTFVIDYLGGTYVSQCEGETVEGAVKVARFAEPLNGFVFSAFNAVELDGCPNAFCKSEVHPESNELVLAHIVKTASG